MRLILLVVFALIVATPVSARVEVPQRAIFSMGFGNCNMFVDGCRWATNLSGVSDKEQVAEDSYYKVIKDGAEIGITAFGYDATSNNDGQAWRLLRMNAAMRRYNDENPSSKRCIYLSYEAAGGSALDMFDAADAGGSESPYCSVDGKPLVGAWQTSACVNPLPGIAARGPFVMMGTMAHATNNVATKACVDTWKASGASRVLNYLWISGNMNLTNRDRWEASKAAAEAAGSEFVMGIPSARVNQCGTDACAGSRSDDYLFRDGKGFQAALQALRAPFIDSTIDKMMFTMSHTGDIGEDSSWDGAEVCDANDTVPHDVEIAGINPNFTCPNVPGYLRGTIPMQQHYASYSNKSFTKKGFHEIAKLWAPQFLYDQAPAFGNFLAFAYREHPFNLDASGFSICPTADARVDANSLGGTSGAGADAIYLTSHAESQVRVRVRMGGVTLGTYTLPAGQAMLDTDDRQVVIPYGANRGRPIFEVLDPSNTVIASVEGDVEITDTPIQRTGGTGRNYSTYADFMPIPPGSTGVRGSITRGAAIRAEGNSGTSDSSFTVSLDRPAPTDINVAWSVSGTEANVDDFFFFKDVVTPPPTTQCTGVTPPPAAAEAGFTRLAFCEDFSDPSRLNLSGGLTSSQTFTNMKPGNIFNSRLNPPSVYDFKAGGTLEIDQIYNNYQAAIMTTLPTGGGNFTGYAMPGSEWYVEARMKHDNCSVSDFPAFWSMANRKIYSSINGASEPDFYEWIGARRVSCLHYYPTGGSNTGKISRCSNGSPGEFNPENFFKVGARMWKQGASYDWWLNDKRTGGVTPPYPDQIRRDRYPIILGNGAQCGPLEVDYIRAWERP